MMNNQVNYYIIVSDISTDNSDTMMVNNIEFINQSASRDNNENSVKTEPIDVYEANIEPENITIKTEITSLINEVKPKNEFSTGAILSTEKVIIKEELNIDEEYDESSPYMHNTDEIEELDPLALVTVEPVLQPEIFECEICGGNFKEPRHLDNHLFIMHRALTVSGTGAYCNKCNKWFTETKYPNHNPCFNYMRSIQNGKKMRSCDICDEDFTAISLLKEHLIEAHTPRIAHESVDISQVVATKIICKICDALFPFKRGLMQHLTLMHRPYTLIGEGAYCTRCKSWFAEENFKDHRPCISPLNTQPVFCCDICNVEFKLLHLYKTHMYVVHRPLALQYCSDAFCDKCNRWFKEDNYTMHKCFRRATFKFKTSYCKYSCMICGKIFVNDDDLKKHLYDVHRPLAVDCNDWVFCDFCKNTFDEDEFEGHPPCHSVDGKCVFCLIAMPNKQHYLLHDLTWKRWRSYQCNICDLNTEDLGLANLNEHMMLCHGKSIFRCVKCKVDFNSAENTEVHVERIHSGCRCLMDSCVCSTYNYDYYYEFVKQRNVLDNKNLLENQILKIREEQYNSIESNIDVCNTRSESNELEDDDPDNFNFLIENDHFQPNEIINNFSMPSASTSISTSTSTSTVKEDFLTNDSESCHDYSESEASLIETEDMLEDLLKEDEIKKEEEVDLEETKLNINKNNKAILELKNKHTANVVIEKGPLGFGFTLVGEHPCKLSNVIPGSPADLAGLQNNDSVIEINHYNVLPFAHDTVVSLIKRCAGKLYMKILFKMPEEKKPSPVREECEEVIVKQPEKETYICYICNIMFTTRNMLDQHLILQHRPTIDEVEEKYELFCCAKCGENFIEYLTFLYHDPCAVSTLDRCTVCFLDKPTQAHFEMHNLLYKNHQYVCTLCPPLSRAVTLGLSAMNEHRKTGHSKLGVFECLKCKLDFCSSDQVKDHLMQHVNNNETMDPVLYKLKVIEPMQQQQQQQQLQYKCEICRKPISSQEKLEAHEKMHEHNHSCSACGKVFANRARLNYHIVLLHSKPRFECHVCESKFVLKKNLRQHLKIHKDKKKFSCEECGQKFSQHTSLICHVASHTRENLLRCAICAIKFDKQRKLSAHMEVHNQDDTNTNKCNVCGKYFTHKCKLIVHLKVHRPNVEIDEVPSIALRRSNRKVNVNDEDSVEGGTNEYKDNKRSNRKIKVNAEDSVEGKTNEYKDKRRSNRKRTQTNAYADERNIKSRKTEIDDIQNKRGKKRKLPPGTSKIVNNPHELHQQEITPKTEYEFDNEDPDEKRKRLNREKQRRWRERHQKGKKRAEKRNRLLLKEKNADVITIENDESSRETNYNQIEEDLEDPVEKKKRLNREKQQRWRQRRSEALDRIWEEKIGKQMSKPNQEIVKQNPVRRETLNSISQCVHTYISEDHQNEDENPQLRKKRLGRERQTRWRNKKNNETLEQIRKMEIVQDGSTQKTFKEEELAMANTQAVTCRQVDMRRKANNDVEARRRAMETPEETDICQEGNAQEKARKRTLEIPDRQAIDALKHARRTGQQSDEEIRRAARKISENVSEQTKAKRRVIQTTNYQEISAQSENSLNDFFDLIMDHWS